MPRLAASLVLSAALSFLLLGTGTEAAGRSPAPLPAVEWAFEGREDAQGNPHEKVFLRVGGKKVSVLPLTGLHFERLLRTEYRERNIPAEAQAACLGWWAGGGLDMYVLRRGRTLKVYCRDLDEQAPIPPYRLLKSVPLTR